MRKNYINNINCDLYPYSHYMDNDNDQLVRYSMDNDRLIYYDMVDERLLTSSLKKYVFYNWLINNILYLCVPLFWGTQKVF